MKPTFLFSIITIIALFSCNAPQEKGVATQEAQESTLGKLQHGFTLNESTAEKFEEGLLLLHNFEYDDALTAFEAATAQDSTEVLTHWGEAMCHYKALWKLQNTEKGKAIINRFGNTQAERMASIKDPIEKDMWKMLEVMYGEGEFDERNKKLSNHLASLHEKNPTNQEIAVFYALSLIWATDEYGDGSDDLRLAAKVCDKVIAANPLHPGALHYKIHALDGPTSASDAHAAADAYAKVAADAAHALHMPSHIYLALGEWDGVVKSNQVSYDASVKRMQDQELKDGARGYHSFAWLHYGLLQQARYTEAEQLLEQMLDLVPKDPTKGARRYLLGMQNRQLVESGKISESIKLDTEVKVDDIGITAQASRSFLKAQLAFQQKDIKTIKEEVKWLKSKTLTASQQVEGDGLVMCAAGTSRYAPTENAVMMAQVVTAQMQGLIALLEGKKDDFEKQMQKAVKLENETNFPSGPPVISNPSFDQYGEWLLAEGRNDEAITQFDLSLDRMPRRYRSLKGKKDALIQLNQQEEAEKIQKELDGILAYKG